MAKVIGLSDADVEVFGQDRMAVFRQYPTRTSCVHNALRGENGAAACEDLLQPEGGQLEGIRPAEEALQVYRQGRNLVGSFTAGPPGEVPVATPEVDAAQHSWSIKLIRTSTGALGARNPAQTDVDCGGK